MCHASPTLDGPSPERPSPSARTGRGSTRTAFSNRPEPSCLPSASQRRNGPSPGLLPLRTQGASLLRWRPGCGLLGLPGSTADRTNQCQLHKAFPAHARPIRQVWDPLPSRSTVSNGATATLGDQVDQPADLGRLQPHEREDPRRRPRNPARAARRCSTPVAIRHPVCHRPAGPGAGRRPARHNLRTSTARTDAGGLGDGLLGLPGSMADRMTHRHHPGSRRPRTAAGHPGAGAPPPEAQ